MQVEIWSDVVCPWCYIGKRRFEQALAQFDHRDEVEVVWRAFELDPSAPAVREGDYATRLAEKYGSSPAQAQAMIDRMADAAAGDGLDFRFDIARPGNTFDAHRLIHLAAEHGLQDALKERLLRATFTEGEPIGDRGALARLATEVGLDAGEVQAVLDGDRYAEEVRVDEQRAGRLGISGVPYFVFDERLGVSGAQSPDVLLDVLEQAWAERPKIAVVASGAEGSCEGDSCAL
ncbi:MAG: 2-hydroxychromene-2-carboxylate isomerase/DsbA-like thioredoxin domain [Acidimicrobiales bacterium]|nr:2-hydroxychromene-2-carboxylate isomerase/DsbA-like thioredoxin domain [Acidimicrobiales bacterium]